MPGALSDQYAHRQDTNSSLYYYLFRYYGGYPYFVLVVLPDYVTTQSVLRPQYIHIY